MPRGFCRLLRGSGGGNERGKEEAPARGLDRAAAAQRLATDPDPKSGEALAKAASDEKWLVRASAVSAIAQRGDPKLLSALLPLLGDDEATVRFTAAAAVVRLSRQEASAGSF